MAKFILIDQSLQGVGGHHFEYALHVLRAAERAGFEVWLAANRRLHDTDKLPDHWKIRPVYHYSTYTKHRLSGDVERPPEDKRPWLSRLVGDWWNDRRRMQRAAAFARDTALLFHDVAVEPGDQVFIPTLSELELLGLAQFLADEPRTQRVDWHLQFHFPILSGCEPDYADQDDRLKQLRAFYNQATLLAADHRLYFYTTTEQLTAQHNRLGTGGFHTLPYPVNPILQTGRMRPADPSRPLKIAYLGDARHEKGYQHLPALVDRLWRDYIETNRAEFVIQSNIQFSLPARGDDLEVVESIAALRRRAAHQLNILDKPAGSETFCRQVIESDVGILLYDRRPYFSRCSGLLVEMLAAGVPVLTSAGCWMADQLAEATRDYHTSLRHNRQVLGKTRAAMGKRFAIPAGAADLLLFFLWPNDPQSAGVYARVETSVYDGSGKSLDGWTMIIGPGGKGRWSTALVRLPIGATAIELLWQNAYGRQPIDFRDAELCFIAANPRAARATPRGAVGLVAADPSQAAELIGDMIDNYPHYRQTAVQFARSWTAWHNADRVVAELLGQRRAIPIPALAPATPAVATPASMSAHR